MITSTFPECADTGKYSIKDTCAILGIHRNSLAKYTKSGAILMTRTRDGLHGYYKGTEIKRFWRAR
jgi:predicted site-specific integrase-resolvase